VENFDTMAKNFDITRRIDRAKIIADKIREHIKPGANKSALEFGCGTGLVGLQLLEGFNTLLFVDSSPEMIKQVEQKLPSATTLCGDLMTNTPQNLKVDYIFSSLVLHHIKDTKNALSQFYNILNTGGHLLIVDINEEDGSFHAKYPDFDGHNGFNHEKLTQLALNAGFKTVAIETFFQDTKIFKGKKNPYSLFILDAVK